MTAESGEPAGADIVAAEARKRQEAHGGTALGKKKNTCGEFTASVHGEGSHDGRTAEELERLEQVIALLRGLATNNEKMAGQMLGIVRVLARDLLALADAPPADRPLVARGARSRAERILGFWGDDERAN